ncbi:MAG: lactoylglutathione lyase [Candidatus Thioglobus sp.]|nr:MAG: lactoylglutathione lyase [Candidatus Thioglobus sp.]
MRILHTMLRVADLNKSIEFYTKILGMDLLRKKDYPQGKFTLAFLGYAPEKEAAALELTYNWEQGDYQIGNGFGHIAVNVDDVYQATKNAKQMGAKIVREAGPMNAGTTIVAFLQDPDGYEIELLSK